MGTPEVLTPRASVRLTFLNLERVDSTAIWCMLGAPSMQTSLPTWALSTLILIILAARSGVSKVLSNLAETVGQRSSPPPNRCFATMGKQFVFFLIGKSRKASGDGLVIPFKGLPS